jgi:hypothetical protein
MATNNPFERFAYSYQDKSAYTSARPTKYTSTNFAEQTFSGHDLQAFFNDIKVGNLESVSWTISTETVGNYVMGKRDPAAHTQGKRVIVGSMVMQQFARHALIQEVFQMHRRGLGTIGDLWNLSQGMSNGNNLRNGNFSADQATGTNSLRASGNSNPFDSGDAANFGGLTNFRGLSPDDFNRQLMDQIIETANIVGATKVIYADQLPAFNITLVGANKAGAAARCTLFGVQITQETGGYSQNDLGSSIGMSFVAQTVSPWTAIETVTDAANMARGFSFSA